jgi:isopentenyl-diphosphate delta-isomerase
MTSDEDRAAAIRARKAEHVELAIDPGAQSGLGAGWGEVELAHASLPEIDLGDVQLEAELVGRRLRAPLVISGMTGGHPQADALNERLGGAAQRHGLAVGVGSQRAALVDRSVEYTYAAVRRAAPDALVIANIGAAQLIPQPPAPAVEVAEVERLLEMVRADALAVHLNFLEEAIQPEGDRRARGCAEAIARLCDRLPVPVIAKETGGGMTAETAEQLRALGVAALDVGGAGGTNFAAIEQMRARQQGDARGAGLGETFANWGVPTPAAIVAASGAGLPMIATGGVRSGLDAAKALALGSEVVGVARPLLAAAMAGEKSLDQWIERFLLELRTALFLSACSAPAQLRERPVVVSGRTRAWIDGLGCALPSRLGSPS